MKETQFHEVLIRRLDVLISLLLDAPAADSATSFSSKIRRLSELGLSPAEIGNILGKPVNYITATLSQQKAARKKGA
jgi:hypothetical protein